MTRVYIICEGQTEQTFAAKILAPWLGHSSKEVRPILLGKAGHKGGNVTYERVRNDIRNILSSDRESFCTTFFDYYGSPPDFPGKRESLNILDVSQKQKVFLNAFCGRLEKESRLSENMYRFIPYVQMFEFEGLLFSNPEKLAKGIGDPSLAEVFQRIRDAFETPEYINNSPQTAPSKRLLEKMPSYQKTLHGILAAMEMGVDDIRSECPLFQKWLENLEKL